MYVVFTSKAPLETIKAFTKVANGALNIEQNKFAFNVNTAKFKGFNSVLQQIHFYENYIESEKYPIASFKGKIIEDVDWKNIKPCEVRAKGALTVHGKTKEIIIKVKLLPKENELNFEANFDLTLEDFNIYIPKIVNQKLAPLIQVNVSGNFN